MKKSLLLLSLIGTMSIASAQTVKYGIKAGANFSSFTASASASSGGGSASSDNAVGFHIGAVADIGLGDFSIQPGVLFSTKGGAGSGSTVTFDYIEVPVNVLYNIKTPAGKLFLGAGPYLAYGVAGSNGVTFGSGSNDIGNPDYGISFLGGHRFTSGIALSGGYDLGLANLNNDKSYGLSVKNKSFNLSVGYFF